MLKLKWVMWPLIWGASFAQVSHAGKPTREDVFKSSLKDLVTVMNSQTTLVEQAYYLDLHGREHSLMDLMRSAAEKPDFDARKLIHPVRMKMRDSKTVVISSSDFEPIEFSYLSTPAAQGAFKLKVGTQILSLNIQELDEAGSEDSAELARAIRSQIKLKNISGRKAKKTAYFLLEALLGEQSFAQTPGLDGMATGIFTGVLWKFASTAWGVVKELDNVCTEINLSRNFCDETLATIQTHSQGFWAGTVTDQVKTAEFVMLANRIGQNYNKIAGGMIRSLQVAGFCGAAQTEFAQVQGKAAIHWTEPAVNTALNKVKIDPKVFTVLCRENLDELSGCMNTIFDKGAKRFNANAKIIVRDPNCPVLNFYSVKLPNTDDAFPENAAQEANTTEMSKKFLKITKLNSMMFNSNNLPATPDGATH